MRRARGALAALAVVMSTSCAGSAGVPGRGEATSPGVTVRTAKCVDWRAAGPAQRHLLVEGMTSVFGGRIDNGQRGNVLPSARATEVFDHACEPAFAAAFRLYRLYGGAVGFTPSDQH